MTKFNIAAVLFERTFMPNPFPGRRFAWNFYSWFYVELMTNTTTTISPSRPLFLGVVKTSIDRECDHHLSCSFMWKMTWTCYAFAVQQKVHPLSLQQQQQLLEVPHEGVC